MIHFLSFQGDFTATAEPERKPFQNPPPRHFWSVIAPIVCVWLGNQFSSSLGSGRAFYMLFLISDGACYI